MTENSKKNNEVINQVEEENDINISSLVFDENTDLELLFKFEDIMKSITKLLDENKLIEASNLYKENFKLIKSHYKPCNFEKYSYKFQIFHILMKRNIKFLCHFTNIKNLESILKNGLIPRQIMDEKGISYIYSDKDRFDNKLDCSSFSISYPNHKMLYTKQNKDEENNIYVIIILDAVKILLNDLEKYYVFVNAASNLAQKHLNNDNKKLTEPQCLEKMFRKSVPDTQNIGIDINRPDNFLKCLTTDPQAEILIKGVIEPANILCVFFANEEDRETFKAICKDNSVLQVEKLIVKNLWFCNREELFGG